MIGEEEEENGRKCGYMIVLRERRRGRWREVVEAKEA